MQLIYRPWTFQDLMEAFAWLPPVQSDAAEFTAQLLIYCPQFRPTTTELRHLLMTHMATKWARVSAGFPGNDVRLAVTNWDNASDTAYRNALTALCDNIKKAFPLRMDLSKIT